MTRISGTGSLRAHHSNRDCHGGSDAFLKPLRERGQNGLATGARKRNAVAMAVAAPSSTHYERSVDIGRLTTFECVVRLLNIFTDSC